MVLCQTGSHSSNDPSGDFYTPKLYWIGLRAAAVLSLHILEIGACLSSERKTVIHRRRLSLSSPIYRSNDIVELKAVDISRLTNRNNETSKQAVYLQRTINLARMLLLLVYPGDPF
jgi:hypothetical protein